MGGLNPDGGVRLDAQFLGGVGVDDQRVGGLDVEQQGVVLGAGVGVGGFLPVDQVKREVLAGLPVARDVDGQGVDLLAVGVGLFGQPDALELDLAAVGEEASNGLAAEHDADLGAPIVLGF